MPKKKTFDIKEWLLEQQRLMNALTKHKQRGKGSNTEVLAPSKTNPTQWRLREDPPIRRFPTSSGELYYGRAPTYPTLAKLRDMGIDLIWNLAAELEVFLSHQKAYVPHVLHGDITDYSPPSNGATFLKQVNQVAAMLRSGKKVFIHCMAGHGRTGIALAAIGVVLDGKTADQALNASHAASGGPETDAQIDFIESLAAYMKTGKPIAEPIQDDYYPYDEKDPRFQKKRVPLEQAKPKEQSHIDKIISRYEQPHKPTMKEYVEQQKRDEQANRDTLMLEKIRLARRQSFDEWKAAGKPVPFAQWEQQRKQSKKPI